MKNNQELGFDTVAERYSSTRGEYVPVAETSAAVSGFTVRDTRRGNSVNLQVGRRKDTYRAYAYIWHHEQDISREGVLREICGRDSSAEQAINSMLSAARNADWPMGPLNQAAAEMRDLLAEGER